MSTWVCNINHNTLSHVTHCTLPFRISQVVANMGSKCCCSRKWAAAWLSLAAHHVKPLGQFIVVLVPHHLKEVQVSATERRSNRSTWSFKGAWPLLSGHWLVVKGRGSPVECGVFVLPQLLNDWLDAQHEELVPEVEAELQVVLEEVNRQTAQ